MDHGRPKVPTADEATGVLFSIIKRTEHLSPLHKAVSGIALVGVTLGMLIRTIGSWQWMLFGGVGVLILAVFWKEVASTGSSKLAKVAAIIALALSTLVLLLGVAWAATALWDSRTLGRAIKEAEEAGYGLYPQLLTIKAASLNANRFSRGSNSLLLRPAAPTTNVMESAARQRKELVAIKSKVNKASGITEEIRRDWLNRLNIQIAIMYMIAGDLPQARTILAEVHDPEGSVAKDSQRAVLLVAAHREKRYEDVVTIAATISQPWPELVLFAADAEANLGRTAAARSRLRGALSVEKANSSPSSHIISARETTIAVMLAEMDFGNKDYAALVDDVGENVAHAAQLSADELCLLDGRMALDLSRICELYASADGVLHKQQPTIGRFALAATIATTVAAKNGYPVGLSSYLVELRAKESMVAAQRGEFAKAADEIAIAKNLLKEITVSNSADASSCAALVKKVDSFIERKKLSLGLPVVTPAG